MEMVELQVIIDVIIEEMMEGHAVLVGKDLVVPVIDQVMYDWKRGCKVVQEDEKYRMCIVEV